jgi:aspartate-semialdehyde dehydrogenase
MVVSTYQAASGAGAAAMEELKLQTQEVIYFPYYVSLSSSGANSVLDCHFTLYLGLGGESTNMQHFQSAGSNSIISWTHARLFSSQLNLLLLVQYAFNIFSHNAPIVENGYNEEEMKMVKETRKIWVCESQIDV